MSIFQNGLWTCGFDFLATASGSSAFNAAGVFDVVGTTGGSPWSCGPSFAQFSLGKGIQIQNQGWIGKFFNVNLKTVYGGWGFNATVAPVGSNINAVFTLYESGGGNNLITLGYNAQGQFGWYKTNSGGLGPNSGSVSSSNLVGSLSPAGTVKFNSYNQLEFLVTIDATSGVLALNFNRANVINFTGNTLTTGVNAFVNQIYFGANSTSAVNWFDNMYLLDNTGNAPLNTFLGNWRVDTAGPNADSATGGLNAWAFTTPQGTDWGNAANIPPVAADFNSSATVGQRMSFRYPNINTSKVLALNAWMQVEQDAAGTRTVLPIYRSNAVDQNGTVINLPTSLTYFTQNSVIDPNTGQPWASGSVAAAQACEIGLSVNS